MKRLIAPPWRLAAFLCAVVALGGIVACKPVSLPPAANGTPGPDWTRVVRSVSPRPMALTASDGTGLKLSHLRVRSVVDDPLAFTELELTFHNPEDRRLEGRFEITLPPGAAISRYAMKIGEVWQEGEVVAREHGHEAYESYLHQGIDPALLEHAGGRRFSARVFPIEPGAPKRLIIAYSQTLTEDAVLVPLQGLPQLGSLEVEVSVAHGKTERFTRKEHLPEGDIGVDPTWRRSGDGLRSRELLLARVRPRLEAKLDPLDRLLLLVDTSASQAVGFDAQLRVLRGLLGSLGDTPVTIGAFDQGQVLVYRGRASGYGPAAEARLRGRGALGASDLASAIAWADDLAAAEEVARVLVIGDGMSSVGRSDAVMRAVRAVSVVKRIDALAMGSQAGEGLKRLVSARTRKGLVMDAAMPPARVVANLRKRTAPVTIEVPGALWVSPHGAEGVQPGDQVLVHARYPKGERPDVPVVRVGGVDHPLNHLRSVDHAWLERTWAKARIDAYIDQSARRGPSPKIDAAVVALSMRHRVLAPQTALMVLETEADYDRWNVDRRALADILTVRGGHVVAIDRPPPAVTAAPRFNRGGRLRHRQLDERAPPGSWNHRWGAARVGRIEPPRGGGLGLSAVEGGATGSRMGSQGFGAPAPGPRGPATEVRMGSTSVSGRMPSEVIRGVLRVQQSSIRHCYQETLRVHPAIEGRMVVHFVIGRDGRVRHATTAGDIDHPQLRECVTQVVRGTPFPRPEGGIITVAFPFVFTLPDGPPPVWQHAPYVNAPEPTTPGGRWGKVLHPLGQGNVAEALRRAKAWHQHQPTELLACIALGQAFEAQGADDQAARAYGSVIDLFPRRADLRRSAGNRLESLGTRTAMTLALDTYREAVRLRPDHPSGHRLLAYAQVRLGAAGQAFETLRGALERKYPTERFRGAGRVLKQDLGLLGAVLVAQAPTRRADVLAALRDAGSELATGPSLRFVLTWETDDSDVDLHVYDGQGKAGGRQIELGSGRLVNNVSTGYGPEAFVVRGASRADHYTLQAAYRRQGAMGAALGMAQVVEHDGQGRLRIDARPFVAQKHGDVVSLGDVSL